MKQKYSYSIPEMMKRLLAKAAPIRKFLLISTSASIIGNLSRMFFMVTGAMWILTAFRFYPGNPYFYAGMTFLLGLVIAVCRYLEGVYSHKGAYGILAGMRVDLFDEIARVSPAYLIDHKIGEILNIATGDIEQLEFFFAHMIGPMFTVILLPLTSLLLAAHFNSLFALILLPIYILVSIVIPLLAMKAGRRIGVRSRSSQGRLKASVLESVYGIRDIQIYEAGQRRMDDMLQKNKEVNKASHGLLMHKSIMSSLPDFFTNLARIAVIAIAGILAGKGKGNPAGTIVVSFAVSASFSSTFSLTAVVSNLLETFGAAERIFPIEDAKPLAPESETPEELAGIETIEFKNVTFAYPHTDKKILDHASFTITKGDRTGIIGESGAGKSTILRLLLRYYDPDEGEILINGKNLKNYSFASIHKRIGLLEQDTYLFDDTIAANISISDPHASLEDIHKAAEQAGIASFIETLPDGYETQMGSMNARLSGGERQRIGIARTLLKNPDVMILDEPTSALDVLHEKELLETLKKEYGNRTVILISHRMTTLTDCTRILSLENAEIIEH